MKLHELASILRMSWIQGDRDIEITGIQFDSRRVKAGDLFICVPGLLSDGHDYAHQAVQLGAVALVTQRILDIPVGQLIVKDARYAMAMIATYFYDHPSLKMKVIGVTGTNGKTTTTYLIEHILRESSFRTGLMGTIQMKIGSTTQDMSRTTLESIDLHYYFQQMVEQHTDYCIMEVSSHALDLGRVKGVRFRSSVFTNLTQDHLDYHLTMENYKAAKGLLFSRLDNGFIGDPDERQYAILNKDDPASADYAHMTAAQVVTYGVHPDCDVRAEDIHVTAKGTQFQLHTFAGSTQIQMKLVGKFNVYNALGAIAATLIEGISLQHIKQSLEQVLPVRGRMEMVSEPHHPFLVLVDYAHTPDGLDNALSTLCEFAEADVITVFGCGGDRDKLKRPLMAKIVASYSQYVIVTSDNPRTEQPLQIIDDIVAGFQEIDFPQSHYELMEDRQQAIHKAIGIAKAGDIVFIAGKGHETYQEIMGVQFDFDDRLMAQDALRSKRL